METLIVVLLVAIFFLCLFIAISVFVLGAAVMRNTEVLSNISSVITSMPPKKRTGGYRYSPEDNLLEVGNTEFPFNA